MFVYQLTRFSDLLCPWYIVSVIYSSTHFTFSSHILCKICLKQMHHWYFFWWNKSHINTHSFENFNLITQIPFLNLDYTNFDQYSCPTCKEVSLEAIICLKYWSLYCYHSHSENRLLWKKIQMKTGNGCFFPPLAISSDSLCNKFVRYLKWLVIKVKGMHVLIQYHISQDLAAI